jgi:hypothetical protein
MCLEKSIFSNIFIVVMVDLFSLNFWASFFGLQQTPAAASPASTTVAQRSASYSETHIIIAAGQSNMEGALMYTMPPTGGTPSNLFLFDTYANIIPAPLHGDITDGALINKGRGLLNPPYNTHRPGMVFARNYARANPHVEVVVLYAAVGGSAFNSLTSAAGTPKYGNVGAPGWNGVLYNNTKNAVAAIKTLRPNAKVKAMLWHQGESEMDDYNITYPIFQQGWPRLIDLARDDGGVFIAGLIGAPNMNPFQPVIKYNGGYNTNRAITQIAQDLNVPLVTESQHYEMLYEQHGINLGFTLHFTSAKGIELGHAYWRKYEQARTAMPSSTPTPQAPASFPQWPSLTTPQVPVAPSAPSQFIPPTPTVPALSSPPPSDEPSFSTRRLNATYSAPGKNGSIGRIQLSGSMRYDGPDPVSRALIVTPIDSARFSWTKATSIEPVPEERDLVTFTFSNNMMAEAIPAYDANGIITFTFIGGFDGIIWTRLE